MEQIKDLIFFPNGNVGAFDDKGEQIGEVQKKGWMQLYFEYLESLGQDPTKIWIEGQLNGGQWKRIVPFKTEWGWNATFEDSKLK